MSVDAVPAEDSTPVEGPQAPYPKPKVEPVPWPKRQRPKDNYEAALGFIGAVIDHINKQGTPLTSKNVDKLDRFYRAYCWNTGLRGKQKRSVWSIVKAQILDVKASAPSPDAEL